MADEDAVARLVNQEWREFPNLQRALKCAAHTGTRMIDIWRVLILYKYGGVYSDIDNLLEDKFQSSLSFSCLSADIFFEL